MQTFSFNFVVTGLENASNYDAAKLENASNMLPKKNANTVTQPVVEENDDSSIADEEFENITKEQDDEEKAIEKQLELAEKRQKINN